MGRLREAGLRTIRRNPDYYGRPAPQPNTTGRAAPDSALAPHAVRLNPHDYVLRIVGGVWTYVCVTDKHEWHHASPAEAAIAAQRQQNDGGEQGVAA